MARFSLNVYKEFCDFGNVCPLFFLKWTNIPIFFQYIFSIKIEQEFWAHFDRKWTNIAKVKTLCKILIIWEHIYWTFKNWKKVDKQLLMATFVHCFLKSSPIFFQYIFQFKLNRNFELIINPTFSVGNSMSIKFVQIGLEARNPYLFRPILTVFKNTCTQSW